MEKVKEQNTYFLPVETPDGIIELEVCHTVVDPNDKNMTVTISATIQDEKIVFQSGTTEDVLIQLAKNLPERWNIRACIACRYGQFCPVGNYDNELFCVTDFEPKSPRDLWHVTEDEEERAKRSHTFFDLCDNYLPQSKDYFTYSDYNLRMDKE